MITFRLHLDLWISVIDQHDQYTVRCWYRTPPGLIGPALPSADALSAAVSSSSDADTVPSLIMNWIIKRITSLIDSIYKTQYEGEGAEVVELLRKRKIAVRSIELKKVEKNVLEQTAV